jgi:2'-5' RNA ligase
VTAAAAEQHPVTVRFAGGGTFGRGGFTVLWAGLGGDSDGLRSLAQRVRAQLRRQRVPFDAKGFRPHLTLARPGVRVDADLISQDVATLQSYVGPEWTVSQLRLVASVLGPNPVHTTIHRAELG